MQGELRQHHQLAYHDETVVLWHNTMVRHCDIPGILSGGTRLPKERQLISRGEQALTRFTTWKVFKREVFHLIYFKRQGVLKQRTFAWGRRGREKVKKHCDRRRTLACQIYKTWSFSGYKKLSTSVLLRFGKEDISQKLVVTSLSQRLWESDLFRATFFFPNLAFCSMFKASLWKTNIYVWEFRSFAQVICRLQAIIYDTRLQNVSTVLLRAT